jgi:hypothetical protein
MCRHCHIVRIQAVVALDLLDHHHRRALQANATTTTTTTTTVRAAGLALPCLRATHVQAAMANAKLLRVLQALVQHCILAWGRAAPSVLHARPQVAAAVVWARPSRPQVAAAVVWARPSRPQVAVGAATATVVVVASAHHCLLGSKKSHRLGHSYQQQQKGKTMSVMMVTVTVMLVVRLPSLVRLDVWQVLRGRRSI